MPRTSELRRNGAAEHAAHDLELVLETAHEAFVSMDEDGLVSAWNRAAERTFGWPKEAALGRPLRDLVIPERYRRRHDEGLRRFLETGEGPLLDRRVEISALHRSGHEFPVELTISAVQQAGTWRFHAFVHDISERYRANELQARLATLVEHSADAIVTRTADGVVTSWNPAAEELFGYPAEEMIGRTLDVLVPEARAGEARELIARVVAAEPVRGFETQRVRKDGRVIDVSITISPIRDDAGAVRELSMIARDVTSRKESERELQRGYRELERLNELKSHFVAVASHELRTPLTSIRGFASTLLNRWGSLADEDKRTFLGHIEGQSERLTRIVGEILTLARIEGGKLPVSPERVDVGLVARRVVAEQGVDGTVDVAGDEPAVVTADPDHVHRILLNLVVNAHAHGSPPYRISIGGDEHEVVVRVSDEGAGVPEALVGS
ncbi:MAG TPA: PAS domain S-box protein, partial [Actinomycetota bacterium]|nr:PAS domain S-box protein [Actinomycetota bacterium]